MYRLRRIGVLVAILFVAGCTGTNQGNGQATATSTAPTTSAALTAAQWEEHYTKCYVDNNSGDPTHCPPIVASMTLTGNGRNDKPILVQAKEIHVEASYEEFCDLEGLPGCRHFWVARWNYVTKDVVALPGTQYIRAGEKGDEWWWVGKIDAGLGRTEGKLLNFDNVQAVRLYAVPRTQLP